MRRLGPPQEGKAGQKSAGSQKHRDAVRKSQRRWPGQGCALAWKRENRKGKMCLPAVQFWRPGQKRRQGQCLAEDQQGPRNLPKSGRMITQEAAVARTMLGRREGSECEKRAWEFGRPGRAWQKRRQGQWLEDQQEASKQNLRGMRRRGRACRIWGKCKARGKAEPWKATWPGQSGPG